MALYYEMDAPVVHASGHAVTGLTAGAYGLARRYLGSVNDAGGTVHHPTVKEALGRYEQTWHRPVTDVSLRIDQLGNDTGASAVTVTEADNDGHQLLAGVGAAQDTQTAQLTRPINSSTPA
jgi:hypothetical protein